MTEESHSPDPEAVPLSQPTSFGSNVFVAIVLLALVLGLLGLGYALGKHDAARPCASQLCIPRVPPLRREVPVIVFDADGRPQAPQLVDRDTPLGTLLLAL